jgi:hypothetical protein
MNPLRHLKENISPSCLKEYCLIEYNRSIKKMNLFSHSRRMLRTDKSIGMELIQSGIPSKENIGHEKGF